MSIKRGGERGGGGERSGDDEPFVVPAELVAVVDPGEINKVCVCVGGGVFCDMTVLPVLV